MATFATVAAKATRLADDLGPDGRRRMVHFLGKNARAMYDGVIADDLGADQAFSNWRRAPKKRVRIAAGYWVVDDGVASIGPKLVGPFQVLDRGRRERAARERYEIEYSDGPRGNRRRYAKAKRAVSATSGRNTAYRAQVVINKKIPPLAEGYVRKTLAKAWR